MQYQYCRNSAVCEQIQSSFTLIACDGYEASISQKDSSVYEARKGKVVLYCNMTAIVAKLGYTVQLHRCLN